MSRNSTSFKPGESGNPGGRPKGSKSPDPLSLRQLRREGEKYSLEMLENLVAISRGEVGETVIRGKGDNAVAVFVVKAADVRAASKDVLEWTYGRPGIRNDDEGLPEGFLSWPLHKRLEWAREQVGKHQALVTLLEAEAGEARGAG